MNRLLFHWGIFLCSICALLLIAFCSELRDDFARSIHVHVRYMCMYMYYGHSYVYCMTSPCFHVEIYILYMHISTRIM